MLDAFKTNGNSPPGWLARFYDTRYWRRCQECGEWRTKAAVQTPLPERHGGP